MHAKLAFGSQKSSEVAPIDVGLAGVSISWKMMIATLVVLDAASCMVASSSWVVAAASSVAIAEVAAGAPGCYAAAKHLLSDNSTMMMVGMTGSNAASALAPNHHNHQSPALQLSCFSCQTYLSAAVSASLPRASSRFWHIALHPPSCLLVQRTFRWNAHCACSWCSTASIFLILSALVHQVAAWLLLRLCALGVEVCQEMMMMALFADACFAD